MASSSNLINDYHLLSYDELDSTNDEARRLAEGGGSHGAVIWARKQSKGRGRLNRKWVSEEGNLFCSILLSPNCELEDATQLSFVAAVAVVDALQPVVSEGFEITCKWPNDILLNGKKLGGILLESFETQGKRWVIVGLGINVDSAPEKTDFPATFLKEAGVEIISAKIVLSRIIHHFIETYDNWTRRGFTNIRREWLKHAHGIDDPIKVKVGKDTLQGLFDGIDTHGNLVIKSDRGRRQTLAAGDVFFR